MEASQQASGYTVRLTDKHTLQKVISPSRLEIMKSQMSEAAELHFILFQIKPSPIL